MVLQIQELTITEETCLQLFRSIFSLILDLNPSLQENISLLSEKFSPIFIAQIKPPPKNLLLVRVGLHAGKMDQVGSGGAEENLG